MQLGEVLVCIHAPAPRHVDWTVSICKHFSFKLKSTTATEKRIASCSGSLRSVLYASMRLRRVTKTGQSVSVDDLI